MLGFVQLHAGFAETTVLRAGLGEMLRSASSLQRKPCSVKFRYSTLLRYMLGSGRSAPDLPRKPCSVLGFSAIVARLRFSRENRAWFLSAMLGSAQVRAGFAEKTLLRAV